MCSTMHRCLLGISTFVTLSTLILASPIPSGLRDVTAPNSQSERTESVWVSSEAISATTSSSQENDVVEDEGGSLITDTVTDLNTAGRHLLDMMTYTVTQTNLTFSHLCRQWSTSHDVVPDSFCAAIQQQATTVSRLPTLRDIAAPVTKKSVYTNVLVVYNLTYQYTHYVGNTATMLLCDTCDAITQCAHVDNMTSTTREDRSRIEYCRVRNLYENYDNLLQTLRRWLLRLRGHVPVIHVIPTPTASDSTAKQEVSIATLAAAAQELSEARILLKHSVVSQF